jgi:hypothetical protein
MKSRGFGGASVVIETVYTFVKRASIPHRLHLTADAQARAINHHRVDSRRL